MHWQFSKVKINILFGRNQYFKKIEIKAARPRNSKSPNANKLSTKIISLEKMKVNETSSKEEKKENRFENFSSIYQIDDDFDLN